MDEAYQLPHAALHSSPSSSFLAGRALGSVTLQPSPSTSAAKGPPPYITHLLSLSRTSLVALSGQGQCLEIDKRNLETVSTWTAGTDASTSKGKGKSGEDASVTLTSIATSADSNLWGVTDRNAKCTLFDNRVVGAQSMQLSSPTSSPLLSLAFAPQSSSAAPLVAVGHELHSVDAPIYVYDLRNPAAPVLTYDQSHSDDVTFLQFFPAAGTASSSSTAPILASGSTDGLMTVYDLSKGADEDDAVLSATNTGSSLARGGWLMPSGDAFGSADGMDAASSLSAQLWAVSDMQTVGIWDAQSTDPLLPPLSATVSSASLPPHSHWPSRSWQTDYVIDALPTHGSNHSCLNLIAGDQSGSIAFINVPAPPTPFRNDLKTQEARAKAQPWSLGGFLPSLVDSAQGGHEDIVRAFVPPDGSSSDGFGEGVAWSGGEDGKIVAWELKQSDTGSEGDGSAMGMTPLNFGAGGGGGRVSEIRGDDVVMASTGSGTGKRRGASQSPGGNANGRFKPYA